MVTALRRMFWLALIGGAAYAAYLAWNRRAGHTPPDPPEWPPLDGAPSAATRTDASTLEASQPAPLPDLDTGTPTAAPLPDVDGVRSDTAAAAPTSDDDGGAAWVEPTDGACPVGFPIKGNANSGIYHVPGGRFYDRTVPERCYATEDAAVADGYRRAKA
ncbi:MAG: hypothetical protein CL424_18055 [Acidimicrobiaceae bacterium]|nr:hypothetical protein [Acidimicrobiaceae bacterium]